jgi:hypothetical protein
MQLASSDDVATSSPPATLLELGRPENLVARSARAATHKHFAHARKSTEFHRSLDFQNIKRLSSGLFEPVATDYRDYAKVVHPRRKNYSALRLGHFDC